MKPPNKNIRTKITKPAVVASTIVWKIEAMNRHSDVEARWRANSRRNWQRNLDPTG
jgi:hypothetical protein